jgi:hypothetical protein
LCECLEFSGGYSHIGARSNGGRRIQMGQINSKTKKTTESLSHLEMQRLTEWFNAYKPTEFACPAVFLGMPSVLWERRILPYALSEREGCGGCRVQQCLDTYLALHATCRTFCAYLGRSGVWSCVLGIQFDAITNSGWRALYGLASAPLKSFRNVFGLGGLYGKAEKEADMQRMLPFARDDNERVQHVKNWQFLTSRRVALELWFSAKCLEEKIWLICWLRAPVVTTVNLANADEGPFKPGDVLHFDIEITPARRNIGVKLKNGNIGKRCGPLPEDDWLGEGAAFCTFDGNLLARGVTNPGYWGHGCVSAYTDSVVDIGVSRSKRPCLCNLDAKHVTCAKPRAFRSSARLMYKWEEQGPYGRAVRFGESLHGVNQESKLVMLFKNWHLDVPRDSSGKIWVLAQYCDSYPYTDNSYGHRIDHVLGSDYQRGEHCATFDDDHEEQTSLGAVLRARSILSQVIEVRIVE